MNGVRILFIPSREITIYTAVEMLSVSKQQSGPKDYPTI